MKADAMRSGMWVMGLIAAFFLAMGMAGRATAADVAFVGKLALVADPEVARELGLSDDTKKKLMELSEKREKEAVDAVAKLRGQSAAKQAEALAPFVAESEKMGKALLDDAQWAKLEKLRVAKVGMAGVLEPDIAQKLQIS